jgi:hypothetical protein
MSKMVADMSGFAALKLSIGRKNRKPSFWWVANRP